MKWKGKEKKENFVQTTGGLVTYIFVCKMWYCRVEWNLVCSIMRWRHTDRRTHSVFKEKKKNKGRFLFIFIAWKWAVVLCCCRDIITGLLLLLLLLLGSGEEGEEEENKTWVPSSSGAAIIFYIFFILPERRAELDGACIRVLLGGDRTNNCLPGWYYTMSTRTNG